MTELNGRRIAFPEVKAFGELFDMLNVAVAQVDPPIVLSLPSWEAGTWSDRSGRTRFQVKGWLRVSGGMDYGRVFHVRPLQVVLDYITNEMLHTSNDHCSFECMVWDDGQALVTCQYNAISGTRYLAVIDAAAIPPALTQKPADVTSEPAVGSVWDTHAGNHWQVVAILPDSRVRVRLVYPPNSGGYGSTHVWLAESLTVCATLVAAPEVAVDKR